MALFMSAANSTTVNLALPSLLQDFNSTYAAVQWVVLSYLVSMAVFLPGIGRWGDLMGRKRVFMQGQLLFTVGAALCAAAPSIAWLIGFRIVQAIGAAMMAGIGIAIVTETWPASQRGTALGIASGCIASGAVVGPLIGGFLLEAFNWRWLFLINIPIGLFSLLVVWRVVPSLRSAGKGERFDLAGAVTIGGALLCFSLALTLGQDIGYGSPWISALLFATLLSLIIFVWIERRVTHPMVDLRLFQDATFTLNLLSALVIFLSLSGVLVILPFYLDLVLGVSQRTMGLLLTILPAAYVATTPLAGVLSDRIGTRTMIGLGLGLTCLSMLLAAQLNAESRLWELVLYLLPMGLGIGAFNTPNTSSLMGRAPRSQLGVVSSLLTETRTLGQASGVALLGSFFALRLQYYAGPLATVDTASAEQIVWALRDDFLVAALLAFGCLVGVLLVWRRTDEAALPETAG
jgi:EmrB/QacA subfamily drug resistance transporter